MISVVRSEVPLSGNRFPVTYLVASPPGEIGARARAIAYEQTVEFPEDLLPEGPVRDQVPGRVEELVPVDGGWFQVTISYPDETVGADFLQYLNVVFGNTSLQPGVRVLSAGFPKGLTPGPRFGIQGLREILGVPRRPLAATALKPQGLPVTELALQAFQTALGGIDLVKDDHGLADQPLSPFQKRVEHCAEAVRKANRESGFQSLYAPNVTSGPETVLVRARFAQEAGAGAVLVSPGLAGFGVLRALASDPGFHLPVIAHPAFTGSFVSAGPGGIDPGFLYGTLTRAAGADVSIFPNFGGRFSFSQEDCLEIARKSTAPLGPVLPSFPSPGGGMSLDRVPGMNLLYGNDFVALVGGGLQREATSLVDASRKFMAALAAGTIE